MLDTLTRKRIDDCRDILVGKLPDPKAQIEQITIGLIYKFMDDMDKEAIELGGNAKFFTDYTIADPEFPNDRSKDKVIEFSKYAWDNLMSPKITAAEMLVLYLVAIEGMNRNPNIPELFRDIFKNAYLPYRDPETLKMFLKTISEFEYSHSEKLGDAFEYLLSVMGSQGDAGQFRTPRHIIDFVTACVNPQKNETVLDPACGTAGFLLSAYKHVLNQNTDKTAGDQLKPDDRKKLATNFLGYDISPDMVRLSLVNMYLHGFTTPHIYEYDTLSSEERWNETADVILANPPFMTPKGGIRPHKKFGVQANKAEVLFTDYIAEHLNSNGRAGIVVPNGIVATSQTAYKQLRKMLVQDSLIAVISLPAGVFQPYSGVKTSVLILDKRLAKKSQHILFLKIENDGFDLGAQRREIDKNDLPLALQTLEAYKECLSNDKAFEGLPSLATLVEKVTVLGNKDIVLNAERYFESTKNQSFEFDFSRIDEICEINPKKSELNEEIGDLQVSFVPMADLNENDVAFKAKEIKKLSEVKTGYTYFKENDVLLAKVTPCFENGKAGIAKGLTNGIGFGSSEFYVIRCSERVLPMWIYLNVVTDKFRTEGQAQMSGTSGLQRVPRDFVGSFEIPLPPLEKQQQIVAEIEAYQKIIDGAKQIVNNYKPTISINPDWEMVELGTLAKNLDGKRKPVTKGDRTQGKYPYYGASGIVDYVEDYIFDDTLLLISEDGANLVSRVYPIAFTATGKFWVNNHAHVLKFESIDLHRYIEVFINQIDISKHVTGAAQPKLNQSHLNEILIPLPSIEEQQTIVKAIEEELQLVNANKRLIEIFEQKIKTKIGEVWGVKQDGIETMIDENDIEKTMIGENHIEKTHAFSLQQSQTQNIAAEPEIEYNTNGS